MRKMQQKIENKWIFDVSDDLSVTLSGIVNAEPWRWCIPSKVAKPEKDYGLILRGPHPDNPERQVLIMAGTRSLGTGAACLAATRPTLIQEIRNRLTGVELTNKTSTIWALVCGHPDSDHHVSPSLVSIEAVGIIS